MRHEPINRSAMGKTILTPVHIDHAQAARSQKRVGIERPRSAMHARGSKVTAFTEALAPLAQTMPRAVRQIEIIRISVELGGDDFAAALHDARDIALHWAQRRAGATLLKAAWEHRDFELVAGGRNSTAVRYCADGNDVWALRAEDPDKHVPGRVWTTEVVLGGETGKRPRMNLRLIASTSEADFRVEPHVPGLVLQMIKATELMRNGRALTGKPAIITTDAGLEELCEHLEDPDRQLPVFIVTLPEAGGDQPLIDDVALARATAGIARVARLSVPMSWALTRRFGKQRSVFDGGVRAYMPQFSASDDTHRHRLMIGSSLRDPARALECLRWLRQLAADHSTTSSRLDGEVVGFAEVRTASRRRFEKDLESRSAPDAERLEALQSLNASLEAQVEETKREADSYAKMVDQAEERATAAELENNGLIARIRQLEKALINGVVATPTERALPTSWSDFIEWVDASWPDRVALTPAARRMVRSPEFRDVEQVARIISWLATEHHDRRMSGGGALQDETVESGILNTHCGGDTYTIDWKGQSRRVDQHIKTKRNTRDPKRCLRIYYFWDAEAGQTVIDHLPSHRRSALT